ncbi:MAG TPA: hypothetical protein VGV59_04410 [Pyrinomonadaceae bacterium]|nr:hypothetical protein [Pyrinomonadaceae bacterium]
MPLVFLLAPMLTGELSLKSSGTVSTDAGTVTAAGLSSASLAQDKVRARVAEARRLLKERRLPSNDHVTLAAEDAETAEIHLFDVPKETFLAAGAETELTASNGESLRLRVVRPNYVNTAVRVSDARGRELRPLAVKYPVVKGGTLSDVAYYTSAHPAVHSRELVNAGQAYVREGLNEAARRLAKKGVRVDARIIDAAERLCTVEHADHKRFEMEDRAALFDEIYTLYALNAGDTYRYSVSSAGAGGMIQMIPPTYRAVRDAYPSVGLDADFVKGMRDHSNALEAMLLYMHDTWAALAREPEVQMALQTGQATQAELLAAGYNSNPARLSTYLARGGPAWRTLIPRETQMYLRIYASLESLVHFKARAAASAE